MNIEITPEYEKVLKCIEQRITPVFISGAGGSGKSTLIHYIKRKYKNVALTAPTGIAALNIGGVTLHSFFSIPPRIITKFDKDKLKPKDVIAVTEILIIDEISMVNANMLDTIEYLLRLSKRNNKPFGGIPVLMFGDLYQLPPVVTSETEKFFRTQYGSPFFFSANIFKTVKLTTVELTKVFRQKDDKFIEILNNVRKGIDIDKTIDYINSNVKITDSYDDAIVLTTTNQKCNKINNYELNKIKSEEQIYFGKIFGDFPNSMMPCDSMIDLKVGAKVICVKNIDNAVNGTIGKVLSMAENFVVIESLSDGRKIQINKVTWENVSYVVRGYQVANRVKGSFTQIPLKLAWALTIHKSQSQTLQRVHIDMDKGSFASGQLYVALSRCTSLEGITLSRPLYSSDIIINNEVIKFYESVK